MERSEPLTYEEIYYNLWETAKRYHDFCQFRVIGSSHDGRLIPMLEMGKGTEVVFCTAGMEGLDRQSPAFLLYTVKEYCRAYECGWTLDELYHVRELLNQVRICFIPLLNPDGYDACRKGYQSIHNPVLRQMLRMQNIPPDEFTGNARGVELRRNFPTKYYTRRRIRQEPASENETKALIHIFQDYPSRGLLSFCQTGQKIMYYRQSESFVCNHRSRHLVRHLGKFSGYRTDRLKEEQVLRGSKKRKGTGSPEQYYTETVRSPAFLIETPVLYRDTVEEGLPCRKDYDKLPLLPLEYLFSIGNSY